MMKGSDIGIQEKKAKLFNEWERFTSTDGESIESYYHRFSKLMNDFKRNKHFPEKIASNLKFLNNLQPEWNVGHVNYCSSNEGLAYDRLHSVALALMAKAFKLNYSTPTNNNQRISSNPRNRQIAQPGMNMGQDRQMQMVGANWWDLVLDSMLGRNVGIKNGYRCMLQNVGNQVCSRCSSANQGVQNIEDWSHLARTCTVRPRRRDAAYLQTQLCLDEIEEVNANCILMANLQQASTSGTQTDNAPVYDSGGSAEVHNYDNCYDNEIFNMFTQEEQYTELLEPIPEPHQVQQNDSNVISEISSVEQEGGTVDQHPATVEETRAYFESVYNNLVLEVDKSVYQEQCLTKKINALHLSSGKQITTLNEEISNLSKQLSTEKSTVSSLLQEKKKLKSDFKIREDELLDKQIQLENKIKELDNILVKTGQSIQTMHMLSPKPDSFYHTEQKMALGYQNPFYLKQAQRKHQCLYDGKVLLEKHDPPVVHDSEETLQLAQEKAAKFVRDFKSLAKEADESLAKHKTLELEIERLLRAVVSQDIMSIVQNPSVVDSSNLQTELDRTKERLENSYNDMQQKIKRLQAQLGDQKGKSKDTPCVSNTLDPLSQKLENENVELEFQVRNYEKEIAHLKTTYKNLFDSISVTRAQTKTIIDSLQNKLQDTIYENAKLRAQLFDKVSEQVEHDTVIAPGMFRMNPFKPSREEMYVPTKVRASVRTNPITVSQPHVVTKEDVNSDSNGLSSTGVVNTAKTRRPPK
ncbi:hypothetical protein Tco_1475703 [Tanacetum coccineum]